MIRDVRTSNAWKELYWIKCSGKSSYNWGLYISGCNCCNCLTRHLIVNCRSSTDVDQLRPVLIKYFLRSFGEFCYKWNELPGAFLESKFTSKLIILPALFFAILSKFWCQTVCLNMDDSHFFTDSDVQCKFVFIFQLFCVLMPVTPMEDCRYFILNRTIFTPVSKQVYTRLRTITTM